MLATAATKGDVIIRNVIPKHLEAITAKPPVEIGAQVDEFDDSVRVLHQRLSHTQVKTLPYPDFLRICNHR